MADIMSQKTSLVVADSRLTNARSLGVKVIGEDEFLAMPGME